MRPECARNSGLAPRLGRVFGGSAVTTGLAVTKAARCAFDLDFDPARKKLRTRYLALHDLSCLANGTNPLFIGIPGTGKTLLARALAYRAGLPGAEARCLHLPAAHATDLHGAEIHGSLDRALRRNVRADLLAIDDFAVLAMDPAQARLAFQVIEYRRATLITCACSLGTSEPRHSQSVAVTGSILVNAAELHTSAR
jgi:DNA replication protein DnaC